MNRITYDDVQRMFVMRMYQNTLGWRRFFVADWWRTKLRIRIKFNHPGYSSTANAVVDFYALIDAEQAEMIASFVPPPMPEGIKELQALVSAMGMGVTRRIASIPLGGYLWNPELGMYEESDAAFRERAIKEFTNR